MKISIQFQYLSPGSARPSDGSYSDNPIETEGGEYLPIPDVDDTVSFMSNDEMVALVLCPIQPQRKIGCELPGVGSI
jgi:hypothetical protein